MTGGINVLNNLWDSFLQHKIQNGAAVGGGTVAAAIPAQQAGFLSTHYLAGIPLSEYIQIIGAIGVIFGIANILYVWSKDYRGK